MVTRATFNSLTQNIASAVSPNGEAGVSARKTSQRQYTEEASKTQGAFSMRTLSSVLSKDAEALSTKLEPLSVHQLYQVMQRLHAVGRDRTFLTASVSSINYYDDLNKAGGGCFRVALKSRFSAHQVLLHVAARATDNKKDQCAARIYGARSETGRSFLSETVTHQVPFDVEFTINLNAVHSDENGSLHITGSADNFFYKLKRNIADQAKDKGFEQKGKYDGDYIAFSKTHDSGHQQRLQYNYPGAHFESDQEKVQSKEGVEKEWVEFENFPLRLATKFNLGYKFDTSK